MRLDFWAKFLLEVCFSGFILSSKRLRMTDETFKNQVFAHCNSDLLNVASRKRKAENL